MMHLQDYITVLSNYCFDIVIAATTLFLVYLIICFLIKYFRECKESDSNNLEAFQNLHEAIIENDMIKAIHSIRKCPEAVNYLHPLDGYSPFMRACLLGHTQLVNIMLKHGADISLKSSKGETPFYLAIFYHIQHPGSVNATCIRTLYYAGCDINATNAKGFTALHLAASFGHINLVKWLLSKGHNDVAQLLQNLELPALE
ncbi:hypothetical protein RN001_014502 [Aquatica leii]|uniref:Ankyrin repeat domain-containing protein n=1 Tax=Aquatica leii TaxID=1421715 RepID=A0AAN7SKK6_9COLE|nr:hypothetical protein RN001_014502 [Aquatica leii]